MTTILRTKFLRVIVAFLAALFILPCEATTVEASSKVSVVKGKKRAKSKKKRSKRKSRAKRACDTRTGKSQALLYIQGDSTLATLAGVDYEPVATQEELRALAADDGEILEDNEAISSLEEQQMKSDEESFQLDLRTFHKLWNEYLDEHGEVENMTAAGIEKKAIMETIVDWLGTRYHFGGTSEGGIDCSAFMQQIYSETAQATLPRTARWQYEVGAAIPSVHDLQFGDLIFFNTRKSVYVSHVGIYLGNNLFAHASSRFGVTISSLEAPYYKSRFIGGRRLSLDDITELSGERRTHASSRVN